MKSWGRAEFGDDDLAVSPWVPAWSALAACCCTDSPSHLLAPLPSCPSVSLLFYWAFLGNPASSPLGPETHLGMSPPRVTEAKGPQCQACWDFPTGCRAGWHCPLVMTCRGATPTWRRQADRTSPPQPCSVSECAHTSLLRSSTRETSKERCEKEAVCAPAERPLLKALDCPAQHSASQLHIKSVRNAY